MSGETIGSIPTRTTSHVSCPAYDFGTQHSGYRIIKTPHTLEGVKGSLTNFSRASWMDLSLTIVPRVDMTSFVVSIVGAWHSTETEYSNTAEILTSPGVFFCNFGAVDTLPGPISVPCNFEQISASTLIKPTPVEGGRVSFTMFINSKWIGSGDHPTEKLKDAASPANVSATRTVKTDSALQNFDLFRVVLRGQHSFGGSA